MKRLHLIFGGLTLAALLAGVLHGGIAWLAAVTAAERVTTSFPAWSAFVLPLMFYALVAAALLLVWLAAWLICKHVKKHCQKTAGMI